MFVKFGVFFVSIIFSDRSSAENVLTKYIFIATENTIYFEITHFILLLAILKKIEGSYCIQFRVK